jgi:hypothetical protein
MKGPITDPLAEAARICDRFQITTLGPQLQACGELVQSNGLVDVAVLGQFKAGKSSFLNALIESEILPVGILPLTALVTRLGFGEQDRLRIRFLSGETRDFPLQDLATFVTEQGNPNNEKQAEAVEVSLRALAPFQGLRFVDTPGLGSVHAHNTQAAMDWLPKVGGALLAIGVNQPFGEQDLKLLLEVSRHTPEILILLTKADLITADQLEAVLAFTQHHASQHLGRPLLVLPFSIQPAFEPMRQAVRDHLRIHILGRHEELVKQILGHKLRAITGTCRAYLRLAKCAAESAASTRAALQSILAQESATLQLVKGEMGVFLRDLQTRARTRSAEHFRAFRGEITRRLQTSLRRDMLGWQGNLAKRRARFERWLEVAMQEEMAQASGHGQGFLSDFLVDAQSSLQRSVRAFQARLAGAIERAFSLSFEGARFQAAIEEPRHPDIRIGKVFDSQVDLLWFLLPMGILGPLFERHFLNLLPWETEKHLSRLANQWAEASQACLDSLVSQAMDFMRQELATVESLSITAVDRRGEIQEALDRLEALEMDPAKAKIKPRPGGPPPASPPLPVP